MSVPPSVLLKVYRGGTPPPATTESSATAKECKLIKVTGVACHAAPSCPGHSNQDVSEAWIRQRAEEGIAYLEKIFSYHGEDEYTALCRARGAPALETAISKSRSLDLTLLARRVQVPLQATPEQLRHFYAAAKNARYYHSLALIDITLKYMSRIEDAFVDTIETQRGVAELKERLDELKSWFVDKSTTAERGPLRIVTKALKWRHSRERTRSKEAVALTASMKTDKKTGKKTGKKVSHKQQGRVSNLEEGMKALDL